MLPGLCEALCLVPTSGKERTSATRPGGLEEHMPSYLAKMTQSTTKAHLCYFLKYHSGERKRETHLSAVDCCPGLTFRTLDTAFGRGEEISWENVKVSLLIIELSHLGLVGFQ